MSQSGRKVISRIEKGHTLIGAVTGVHVAAIVIAFVAILFGMMRPTVAEDNSGIIYSPCWSKQECLGLNTAAAAESVPRQDRTGFCANDRCWCDQADCRDPRRVEPNCPAGQGKCYSNPPAIPLVVAVGNSRSVLDVGDYIAKVYNYGVTVAGLIAGMMFIIGGFQFLTAGGDSGRVTKAKERIKDSLVGLLLVFGAYVILNTINPDTLRLQMPKVPMVRRKVFIACQYFELQKPCGERFLLIRNEGVSDSAPLEQRYRLATSADASGTGQTTECIGKSCSRAGSDDATHRCKIPPNTRVEATNTPPPPPSPNNCASAPTAPYQCLPCTRQGGGCRGGGPNQDCCGGFCSPGAIRAAFGDIGAMASAAGVGGSTFQGFCTNGNNGVQCGTDAECFSRHCVNVTGSGLGGICASGENGAPCRNDTHCNSGKVCVEDTGVHVCVIPRYLSPCDADNDCPAGLTCYGSRCGGNMRQECSNDAGCAVLAGALAPFGPMRCWTDSQVTGSAMNRCKPFIEGSVCIPGGNQNECGPNETCFDGAISDRSIRGAGLCTLPIGGAGCDEGSECRRMNPRSDCRQYQGITGGNKGCSLRGTAGIPCIGSGVGGGITNTCDPPLTCPDGVFRCVESPTSACGGGGS